MKTLSAVYVVRNEGELLQKSIDFVYEYVDEIVVVNMGELNMLYDPKRKIKVFDYPYNEPVDMGKARTFSLSKVTSDWFLQVDADEFYPKESMEKIREAIEDTEAQSIRVKYYNVAWRHGYVEPIEHYPDRLYRTDIVEKYHGVLPLDMTIIKPEFRQCKYKGKGMEGVMEYDNPDDRSFEHPFQPIRQDIYFYHLARCRGYNFEYNKRLRYENFIHGKREENERNTRANQWVNGMYAMEKHDFPDYIPQRLIPNPKVSIIITNYNYGQYIQEAIESCKNQTVSPFEIIVVDDCSTDDSMGIIDSIHDIHVLRNSSNVGVALARNVGIEYSTGDYFTCLDADDCLADTFIERTLEKMAEGDAEIVFTDMHVFGDIDYVHHYPDFSIEELRKNQIIPSACALVDRRCADPYGIFDPTEHYEDYGFWLRMAITKEYRFKQVHEPLFEYRRKKGSRIEMLDEKQEYGFNQLKERYGKTT